MAHPGFGTLLKMGDGATPTETFQTIGEVLDINGGGFSVATEDATSHDSPEAWAENIATIITASEVTFQVQYDPTDPTHDETTGLWAQGVSRVLRNFQLVPPIAGAKTLQFAARVTNLGPQWPVQGKIIADVTLTPSGKPSWVTP